MEEKTALQEAKERMKSLRYKNQIHRIHRTYVCENGHKQLFPAKICTEAGCYSRKFKPVHSPQGNTTKEGSISSPEDTSKEFTFEGKRYKVEGNKAVEQKEVEH